MALCILIGELPVTAILCTWDGHASLLWQTKKSPFTKRCSTGYLSHRDEKKKCSPMVCENNMNRDSMLHVALLFWLVTCIPCKKDAQAARLGSLT
jgi:hypothetical protein